MRKNQDEYFLDIAELVSTRSTCKRLQVGFIIVKKQQLFPLVIMALFMDILIMKMMVVYFEIMDTAFTVYIQN